MTWYSNFDYAVKANTYGKMEWHEIPRDTEFAKKCLGRHIFVALIIQNRICDVETRNAEKLRTLFLFCNYAKMVRNRRLSKKGCSNLLRNVST